MKQTKDNLTGTTKEVMTISIDGKTVGEITEEVICEYKLNDSTTLAISMMQYPGSDEKSLLLTSTNVNEADDQECIFLGTDQALELADQLKKAVKKIETFKTGEDDDL